MITKKIWEDWRKGEGSYYTSPFLKLLKGKRPPEEFISRKEFLVLRALNSDMKPRTQVEIRYLTGLSYPFINYTIQDFQLRGIVTSTKTKTTRKGLEKPTNKRFVKLTEKGLKLLKEWKEVYEI